MSFYFYQYIYISVLTASCVIDIWHGNNKWHIDYIITQHAFLHDIVVEQNECFIKIFGEWTFCLPKYLLVMSAKVPKENNYVIITYFNILINW